LYLLASRCIQQQPVASSASPGRDGEWCTAASQLPGRAGLRLIGHVTRLTWQAAAPVAPDASLRHREGRSPAASSPISYAARRRATVPRTCPARIAVAGGGRSWPGPAARLGRLVPAIVTPGSSLQAPAHAEVFSVVGTLLSTSLLAGVPVHVVAARLGHADPSVTLRVYAHVIRSAETLAADIFAQTIRAHNNAAVSKPVSKKPRPKRGRGR
jgi:integrase